MLSIEVAKIPTEGQRQSSSANEIAEYIARCIANRDGIGYKSLVGNTIAIS